MHNAIIYVDPKIPIKISVQRKSCPIALGVVDFAFGLVIFVLNLHNGFELFFREIQITEGL